MPALAPGESLKGEEDSVGTSSLQGVNPTVAQGAWKCRRGGCTPGAAHACSPACGSQANKSLLVALADSKNVM